MQRREKKFLFWKWTAISETRYSEWIWDGLTKTSMQRVAERLVEKRNAYIESNRSDLFGDYPPKTLLDTSE